MKLIQSSPLSQAIESIQDDDNALIFVKQDVTWNEDSNSFIYLFDDSEDIPTTLEDATYFLEGSIVHELKDVYKENPGVQQRMSLVNYVIYYAENDAYYFPD